LGAVLLIIARALLPIIGLGGIAGELIQPLTKLTPILVAISLAAITLITFNLKLQTKLAKKWVEEAGDWDEAFVIGAVVEPSDPRTSLNTELVTEPDTDLKTASLKLENLPERPVNYQADERNGSSNGRVPGRSPAFTTAPEGEGLKMAVGAAPARLGKARGERRTAAAEVVRELSEDRANYRGEIKNNVSSTDDDVFARYRHLIESPFSPMATFHQLPPPLPEFVGRSAELVELYAARANH